MNRPIENNTPHSPFIRESTGRSRRGEATRAPRNGAANFKEVLGDTQTARSPAAKETATRPAASPNALPTAGADLPGIFGPAGFEAHMNQWFMNLMRRQNEARTQAYELAMSGWRNVNARNRELGIPEVPPPPPPQLEPVEPKEPGWWFQIHS